MEKRIYLVALFLTVSKGFSQAPELQSEVKKLYTACHDIDIGVLSEMLCSNDGKIYSTLDTYFLNDDTKFRYVETNAKYNYGVPKSIEGRTYVPVNFRNVVRVTYFKPIVIADKQAELKVRFNSESVVYNAQRNAFMITYNARILAINDGSRWKFAFLDETLPKVSEECITDDIKKEFRL